MNGIAPISPSINTLSTIKISTLRLTPCLAMVSTSAALSTNPAASPAMGSRLIIGSSPKRNLVPGTWN